VKIHVEVFIASELLGRRQETFSSEDLRREIERLFDDTRPGVNTHISAHCVGNAPRNAGTVYNYLFRIDDGVLRPFDPGQDRPHNTRAEARLQPDPRDIPRRYRYLLRQ
jgi:hypothetical protein